MASNTAWILTSLLLLGVPLRAEEWRRVAQGPAHALALTAGLDGTYLGFSDETGRTALFSFANDNRPAKTLPLDRPPAFFGYGYSVDGQSLCLPRDGHSETVAFCFDGSLTLREMIPLGAQSMSLALTRDDELWSVQVRDGTRLSEVAHWKKTSASGWVRLGLPVLIQESAGSTLTTYSLHPLGGEALALIPDDGKYDGVSYCYPSIITWRTDSGPSGHIPIPSVEVKEDLRPALKAVRNRPIRLIYRAAASPRAIAIVPVLPAPEDKPYGHNEVWFRNIAGGTWHKSFLPRSVGAVAFKGDDLFAITDDGVVWRYIGPK